MNKVKVGRWRIIAMWGGEQCADSIIAYSWYMTVTIDARGWALPLSFVVRRAGFSLQVLCLSLFLGCKVRGKAMDTGPLPEYHERG